MDAVSYLHLPFGQSPPDLSLSAFRAVIVVEEPVSNDWRNRVSEWLVRSGCLYMSAWGSGCSEWDDSIDYASLAAFDYGDIPDKSFVMTTWHEDETLEEAFWFAGHCASHPNVELTHTLLVHIAPHEQSARLLSAYRKANPS